jgi:hypothetical protein
VYIAVRLKKSCPSQHVVAWSWAQSVDEILKVEQVLKRVR